MLKKIKILGIALVISISSLFLISSDELNFEFQKNLDIYHTLLRELNIFYVDEIDAGKLIKTSVDEMLKSLDPYTVYYPESEIEDYSFMTTGQYGGVGALIHRNGDQIVISEPYENFPAFKAGLKAGDVLIEVQGNTTSGKNVDDISKFLKGQPNTTVKIVIKQAVTGNIVEKTITREQISIKSVPYFGMLNDHVGYIRLDEFTENAGKEVKDALINLKDKQKATSIVLDLRGNPGGLLIEAVNIVNWFVPKGQVVVSTKGKVAQWNKNYEAMFSAVDEQIPLVVLVNRMSASASEIVSGALQDLDRAVIIGQRSYGKGLVQTTRDLTYNTKLKVTTAKYYIPSERCIQALDYTHRNKDGSVGKVPDSLISKFKTRNGREVSDGGGILPDVILPTRKISKIAQSLYSKYLIFDYATIYAHNHDSIPSAKTFKLSDAEYDAFLEFLKEKNFDYETKSEGELKQLIAVATNEKYFEKASEEFKALQLKLAHDKNKDLRIFKDEIIDLLSEEIISRYYFQVGRVEHAIAHDEEVKKAVEILDNQEKYTGILKGTYKETPKEETAEPDDED